MMSLKFLRSDREMIFGKYEEMKYSAVGNFSSIICLKSFRSTGNVLPERVIVVCQEILPY